ncbi:winged helix-turn-helix domain-containing protein [[Eubacterium] cellulosolvens]
MAFKGFHPKAYLKSKRNVRTGLRTRTLIIELISKKPSQIKGIANETNLSYRSIAYHVKTLKKENILTSSTIKKPLVWKLTRFGQQKLV